MSNLHVKYLLVGGGVAANAAAKAIRAIDSAGEVLLVGQEIHRPYNRPPLSKEFLRREQAKSDLFTEASDWYTLNHVQLRTGRRVAQVDPGRDCVTLDNGEEISFDRLLIATGGAPAALHIPGAHLPNLFYLRTMEDAEHLLTAIDKAKREGRAHPRGRGRATVIGAGVLGVELAGSLTQAGMAVDLVASKEFVWDRFAGEAAGRLLARYLEKHGVTMHLANRAQRVEGDGRAQRVVLASGELINCDFAVAAVGMQVQKEVLRGSPIVAEKAILVDAQCRSSQPNVFAAGDCAAVLDPLFGKHRLMAHWDNASITGTIAGTNMAGGHRIFDAVSQFTSSTLGLTCSVWGEAKLVDHRLVRGIPNPETPDLVEFGIAADGRIAQVLALGHANENSLLENLVRQRTQVAGKEEQLRDPDVPLAALLA